MSTVGDGEANAAGGNADGWRALAFSVEGDRFAHDIFGTNDVEELAKLTPGDCAPASLAALAEHPILGPAADEAKTIFGADRVCKAVKGTAETGARCDKEATILVLTPENDIEGRCYQGHGGFFAHTSGRNAVQGVLHVPISVLVAAAEIGDDARGDGADEGARQREEQAEVELLRQRLREQAVTMDQLQQQQASLQQRLDEATRGAPTAPGPFHPIQVQNGPGARAAAGGSGGGQLSAAGRATLSAASSTSFLRNSHPFGEGAPTARGSALSPPTGPGGDLATRGGYPPPSVAGPGARGGVIPPSAPSIFRDQGVPSAGGRGGPFGPPGWAHNRGGYGPWHGDGRLPATPTGARGQWGGHEPAPRTPVEAEIEYLQTQLRGGPTDTSEASVARYDSCLWRLRDLQREQIQRSPLEVPLPEGAAAGGRPGATFADDERRRRSPIAATSAAVAASRPDHDDEFLYSQNKLSQEHLLRQIEDLEATAAEVSGGADTERRAHQAGTSMFGLVGNAVSQFVCAEGFGGQYEDRHGVRQTPKIRDILQKFLGGDFLTGQSETGADGKTRKKPTYKFLADRFAVAADFFDEEAKNPDMEGVVKYNERMGRFFKTMKKLVERLETVSPPPSGEEGGRQYLALLATRFIRAANHGPRAENAFMAPYTTKDSARHGPELDLVRLMEAGALNVHSLQEKMQKSVDSQIGNYSSKVDSLTADLKALKDSVKNIKEEKIGESRLSEALKTKISSAKSSADQALRTARSNSNNNGGGGKSG